LLDVATLHLSGHPIVFLFTPMGQTVTADFVAGTFHLGYFFWVVHSFLSDKEKRR
jgi:hypothetical protein